MTVTTVTSGEILSGHTVASGDELDVLAGGKAVAATIDAACGDYVLFGLGVRAIVSGQETVSAACRCRQRHDRGWRDRNRLVRRQGDRHEGHQRRRGVHLLRLRHVASNMQIGISGQGFIAAAASAFGGSISGGSGQGEASLDIAGVASGLTVADSAFVEVLSGGLFLSGKINGGQTVVDSAGVLSGGGDQRRRGGHRPRRDP